MNTVRRRRLQLTLSQTDLARRMGCTQSFVSQIESGRILRPAYDTVILLARALECEPADLVPAPKRVAR